DVAHPALALRRRRKLWRGSLPAAASDARKDVVNGHALLLGTLLNRRIAAENCAKQSIERVRGTARLGRRLPLRGSAALLPAREHGAKNSIK
ncbi:MAG TPA: hypothetical protein PKY66_01535, partial [Thermoflexales bacterium]|nr:hypothetical protein [Thermoflexales bacterium]HRA53396.1 hypothetical protein [Thermoflexales bacterium]